MVRRSVADPAARRPGTASRCARARGRARGGGDLQRGVAQGHQRDRGTTAQRGVLALERAHEQVARGGGALRALRRATRSRRDPSVVTSPATSCARRRSASAIVDSRQQRGRRARTSRSDRRAAFDRASGSGPGGRAPRARRSRSASSGSKRAECASARVSPGRGRRGRAAAARRYAPTPAATRARAQRARVVLRIQRDHGRSRSSGSLACANGRSASRAPASPSWTKSRSARTRVSGRSAPASSSSSGRAAVPLPRWPRTPGPAAPRVAGSGLAREQGVGDGHERTRVAPALGVVEPQRQVDLACCGGPPTLRTRPGAGAGPHRKPAQDGEGHVRALSEWSPAAILSAPRRAAHRETDRADLPPGQAAKRLRKRGEMAYAWWSRRGLVGKGGETMQGLMQDWPLLVPSILEHANINHPEQEVVTRSVEGPIHRYRYADLYTRSQALRQGAHEARRARGRRGRDAGLEHPPAHGGLVRHHGHRRGVPHAQPAAVPRSARLHREPRRGQHTCSST